MVELTDKLSFIEPDWPAPDNIKALVTTRQAGASKPPFASFNLGMHVGDNPEHVLQNRQQLQKVLSALHKPQWLQQVHGVAAVEAQSSAQVLEADACFTSKLGLPCAVMTADCLPVLFCNKNGDRVAAAHAGWRGLADGVLEATVEQMKVPASELLAWFGPAIGPQAFEVGADVRDAFLACSKECDAAFVQCPGKPGHWLADIYQLAAIRLNGLGIVQVFGGGLCTFSDEQRFFSYRRDGMTGRMASLIWISN